MKAVDLFAGAGGLSLGARLAGIDVIAAVEKDADAARTYSRNHPNTTVLCDDVRRLSSLPPTDTSAGTLLFGGPPCQGYSTSNQRTRDKNNPENWLFLDFSKLAKSWKPDWIVYENVRGILETKKGFFLQKVINSFQDLNYTVSVLHLNAADHGVPQHRHRVFVVASLDGITLAPLREVKRRHRTVKEAIGDLPALLNGANYCDLPYRKPAISDYAKLLRGGRKSCSNHLVTTNAPHVIERYKHIPQGGNWENIPRQLLSNYKQPLNCHTGLYRRLRNDKPAIVLSNYRKNMVVHPTQQRGLSVREAARLQSFPDDYEFTGSIGFQQQQVANAVPPLMAKAVFERITRITENHYF